MQDIADKLGTEEYTKALSEFAVEQPNLQKMLTEVMYTKEDTYHFFIEVAEKCTGLIERFFMSTYTCIKMLVYIKHINKFRSCYF